LNIFKQGRNKDEMSRRKEDDRLTDRCEYLTQHRLKVTKNLSRYLNDFPTTKEYVQEILQSQMNEIAHQFRIQPRWQGLMFWEGMSPGLPKEETRSDEDALVVSMDALQISLMLFRRLTLTKDLSEDKWFKQWNRVLSKDGGQEREFVLQGCIAGICDYVVVAACQKMQMVKSAKVRNRILTQYRASINQFYQEQEILCKGLLDEERLYQLREIWRNGQSISAYYMGVVCSGGNVDRNRDAILKEFEFWKIIQWLHNKVGESDENLRCGDCCTNERLRVLAESKALTEELRQLLCFCIKMPT